MRSGMTSRPDGARYENPAVRPTSSNVMTLIVPLDRDWSFRRLPAKGGWDRVELPHTPFVADLDGLNHWFGECEYQRMVQWPADASGGRCTLYVGAAMHTAEVLVDGTVIGRHAGGYLPFEVDLTDL